MGDEFSSMFITSQMKLVLEGVSTFRMIFDMSDGFPHSSIGEVLLKLTCATNTKAGPQHLWKPPKFCSVVKSTKYKSIWYDYLPYYLSSIGLRRLP